MGRDHILCARKKGEVCEEIGDICVSRWKVSNKLCAQLNVTHNYALFEDENNENLDESTNHEGEDLATDGTSVPITAGNPAKPRQQ